MFPNTVAHVLDNMHDGVIVTIPRDQRGAANRTLVAIRGKPEYIFVLGKAFRLRGESAISDRAKNATEYPFATDAILETSSLLLVRPIARNSIRAVAGADARGAVNS